MRNHWDTHYKELVTFRKENGHCNVPTNDEKNRRLGQWVSSIRYKHKIGELEEDKVTALDDLDFVWSASDLAWQQMYESLVTYARAHGTTNVHEREAGHEKLARWVHSQRHRHKRGKMAAARLHLLDDINFCWTVRGNGDAAVETPHTEHAHEDDIPPIVDEEQPEKLYALRGGGFAQYAGEGDMPEPLSRCMASANGELPPHIPLPLGPVRFMLGNRFYRQQEVSWSGSGPLPELVMQFVDDNGTLPRYERELKNA